MAGRSESTLQHSPRRHPVVMYKATLLYICVMLTIIVGLLVWYFGVFS